MTDPLAPVPPRRTRAAQAASTQLTSSPRSVPGTD